MMLRRRLSIVAISGLAVIAATASASAAQGATTFGSDLTAVPDAGVGCPGGGVCTGANVQPAANLTSPIDGVIVRWRVKTDGDGAGSFANLRVLRPGTVLGTFTAVGVSDLISMPALAGTYPNNTRVSVKAGDRLGMDASFNLLNVSPGEESPADAKLGFWQPPLAVGAAEGAPTIASMPADDWELLINADVEVDTDRDGFGDETQDCAPTDPAKNAACPPPTRKCKKGFRLKKVKTKRGKRKKRCVRKKRKRKKK